MRVIKEIVVHCSATPPGMDIGAAEIRSWHVSGNGWSDIGYHYVVRLDGRVENGRPESRVGAHVKGYNSNSIGVCYVGGVGEEGNPKDTRTDCQKEQLLELLKKLKWKYPGARILGHRDFPRVAKACPSFDAKMEYEHLTTS